MSLLMKRRMHMSSISQTQSEFEIKDMQYGMCTFGGG